VTTASEKNGNKIIDFAHESGQLSRSGFRLITVWYYYIIIILRNRDETELKTSVWHTRTTALALQTRSDEDVEKIYMYMTSQYICNMNRARDSRGL